MNFFGPLALAATALLTLAACEPTAGTSAQNDGTVLKADGTELRVATGERIANIGGGTLTILHVTRADGKSIGPDDGPAARSAYAGYCRDKGGPGVGAEGYFSQFGGSSAWKFGGCGA